MCSGKKQNKPLGVKVTKRLNDLNQALEGGAYADNATCLPDYGGLMASPSLMIIEKSSSEAWLFASKCAVIRAWKLTWNGTTVTETVLPIDGQTEFDTSVNYGTYIQSWALSPDRKTLFGAPSGTARAGYARKLGIEGNTTNIDRMNFLVLDVSGSAPRVSTASQYNKNVDNYKGKIQTDTSRDQLATPEIDHGMPVLPFSYDKYFHSYNANLAGVFSFEKPNFHNPFIVVSNNNLWYIQNGNKNMAFTAPYGRWGVATLGHYRDIAVYDLEKAEMLYFPNNNATGSEKYFHPYAAANTTNRSTGFKLQPDTGEITDSMGIVYIAK